MNFLEHIYLMFLLGLCNNGKTYISINDNSFILIIDTVSIMVKCYRTVL